MNHQREIFAVKVFSRSFLKMQKTWSRSGNQMVMSTALEKVEREIALMKRLRHPNLVRLIDVVDDEEQDQIYMVIEYVENGQVMYYDPSTYTFYSRKTHGVLPEEMAKKYLYDIVSGLKYLHQHKVVHRDIKPENILISKDDHCKIVDFGVAHIFDTLNSNDGSLPESTRPLNLLTRANTGLMRNTAGTVYFYPPECCSDEPYNTYAADIWALGVTLFAMVVGRLPLFNPDCIAFMDDLMDKEIEIPTNLSADLQDLLRRFLEKDPSKRISIDEILAHPWLQGYSLNLQANLSPNISRESLSTIEIQHALSRISVPEPERIPMHVPEMVKEEVPEPVKEEEVPEKKVIEDGEKKGDESSEKVDEAVEMKVDESTEKNLSVENLHNTIENTTPLKQQVHEEKQSETKPSETSSDIAIHSESPSVEEEVASNSYCCCV
ncbi:hypothetical protein WA538_004981, partial [Blastocystis sp. DL]